MTRKLLDFCELDWNDNCLSFYKSKRDVNTPSYDQVRKPLYKKSLARWKNYEKHLQPLLNRLGDKNRTMQYYYICKLLFTLAQISFQSASEQRCLQILQMRYCFLLDQTLPVPEHAD